MFCLHCIFLAALLGLGTTFLEAKFAPSEAKIKALMVEECGLKERVRPVVHYGDTLNVNISLQPSRVLDLNEPEQRLTIAATLELLWHHPCVAWNVTDWDGVERFELSASEEKYFPRMQLSNSFGEIMLDDAFNQQPIGFYSYGSVKLQYEAAFVTACPISLKQFPFDRVTCTIQFESYVSERRVTLFTEPEINIYHDPLGPFLTDADVWILEETHAELAKIKYENFDSGRVYDRAVYFFRLKRKPGIFVLNIIIPSFFLVVLMYASVLMPPKNPDRACYLITVVLAYGVLQSSLTAQIPKSSEVAYIVLFLLLQLGAGMLFTLYALLTCELARRSYWKSVKKPGGITRIRLLDFVFLCVMLLVQVVISGYIFLLMLDDG